MYSYSNHTHLDYPCLKLLDHRSNSIIQKTVDATFTEKISHFEFEDTLLIHKVKPKKLMKEVAQFPCWNNDCRESLN